MRHLFLVIGLTSFCATLSMAQESSDTLIERNVDVVKEYNPVIKDAGKINTMPEIKPIETKKAATSYSVWTTPFEVKASEIRPLDYATARPIQTKMDKQHFARLGGGNYGTILGELYTPIFQKKNWNMDLDLKHRTSFGYVKMSEDNYPAIGELEGGCDGDPTQSKAFDSDTKGKLDFATTIRQNKELSAFAAAEYDAFRYYGYDDDMLYHFDHESHISDNMDYKQHHLNVDGNVRFKSKEFLGKWYYDCQTNYQLFSIKDDLKEHTIYTKLGGMYRSDRYTVGLDIDMHNIFLSLPGANEEAIYDYHFDNSETMNNYTMLKLTPRFIFDGEIGMMNIGIKAAFGIGQGKKGAVCPDISGTIKLKKDVAYLYACVTGDYEVKNYRTVAKENKYVAPDVRIADTYTPIDVYAGVRVKIAKRVDMDVYGGYKIINNPYFFVNKYRERVVKGDTISVMTRQFDVVYEKNAGVFNAGISLGWHYKDRLDMGFNAVVNKWALEKNEYAWQRPDWMLDYHMNFNVTKSLRLNLAYEFEGGRYALVNKEAVKMRNAHNLSFGADYKLLNWLDVFAKFDNMINQPYQSWYGYDCHKFNFLAGLSFFF